MSQLAEKEDTKKVGFSVGAFSKMVSSIMNASEPKEQVLLQTEIEQLEGLVANMKSDLDELERGRAKSRFSSTLKGKIWSVIDTVFSVYCVYKFIVTLINVLLQRNTTDPITNMLSMMISHFDDVKIDAAFWSQQLSFWFAGVIVFGSVRGFMKLLTRVLDMFLFKITFSSSNRILFVAHMMGMYFLSSVLMMQLSLPTEYRYLLHSTEFDFFKHWSDVIFVGSSLVSLCVIYVIYQTHDAKSMATDFADVELLNMESGRSLIE
ncbi:hypothetical protein K501DRAFT_220172 [Backusella circina FSU 941]|nr:hypothetical protein K501DRAFT_220172 [Backusella circina FSU 941]